MGCSADRFLRFVTCAVSAIVAGGCSSSLDSPFHYNEPPSVQAGDVRRESYAGRTLIVVGQFANPPSAPIATGDIGSGMSDALSKAILKDGQFDVYINPVLARSVETSVKLPPPAGTVRPEGGLPPVPPKQDYPDVDFLITGKVTDFNHTNDLAPDIARSGLFGRRNEAVCAIEFEIIDVRARRLVASDHVVGTAAAPGNRKPSESYKGIGFGSYLFWSTPLGSASRSAIERLVAKVRESVPLRLAEPSVASRPGHRQITIAGGSDSKIRSGETWFLYRRNEDGVVEPVLDKDTAQPLRVRIDTVDRVSATGWLLGEPPVGADLRGAILRQRVEPSSAALVREKE